MKILPLPRKLLDLCVAWMTTYNGGSVSSRRSISTFVLNTLTLKYSQTSLIRTPKGQNQDSVHFTEESTLWR